MPPGQVPRGIADLQGGYEWDGERRFYPLRTAWTGSSS